MDAPTKTQDSTTLAGDLDCSDLQAKVRQLEKEVETAREEKREERNKFLKANLELQRERQIKAIREELAEKHRHLAQYLGTNVNEEEQIRNNWTRLESATSYLTGTANVWHADKRAVWDGLDPETRAQVLAWAPNAERYLDSSTFWFKSLLRAWIWRILDDEVFTEWSAHKYRGFPLWAEYGTLRNVLRNQAMGRNVQDTVKFHFWRHLGASMIRRIEPEQMSPKPIIDRIKRELGPFFRGEDGDQAIVDKELEEIANLAVMIEIRMQTEKAHYCVLFCHPDTFDQRDFSSEPEDGAFKMLLDIFGSHADAEKTVDLVVSPLLRRRGTEDGLDYHTFDDVRPMKVVLSEDLNWFSEAITMKELPAFLARLKQEQEAEQSSGPQPESQPESPPEPEPEPRYSLRARTPRVPAKVIKSNKKKAAAAGRKTPPRAKRRNNKNEGEEGA